YGNYPSYYTRRHGQAESIDPRLALLPQEWFRGKRVLDIGCNAGHLTVDLAMHYGPQSILGVDLDRELIRKAWAHVRHRYSTLAPAVAAQAVPSLEDRSYFPSCFPRLLGTIPLPPHPLNWEDNGPRLFPRNIRFQTVDWIVDSRGETEEEGAYDVILCLSVAKWIHLHHGDKGIRRLFDRAFRSLAPMGRFILEPQAWSTYARRAKMSPKMQQNYDGIQLKPDDFVRVLVEQVGF
ncbi:Bicoid-interacting protein 3-domain-containing protein, partial [Piptocephalis cylindrospora]